MRNEDRISQKSEILFQAIHSLFNEKIESKNEVNEYIMQWQNSETSLSDCIEILFHVKDPHILFVAIKTIQQIIRFSCEKIIENGLSELIVRSFLDLLKTDDLPSIHQDFVLICICDISNQIGNLEESIVDSIPRHLILRFFAFFFENWYEPFVTYLIQPNFVNSALHLLGQFDTDINWLRICKAIFNEMNDFSILLPYCTKFISFEPHKIEEINCMIDIFSILCTYEFPSCELLLAFLDLFMKISSQLSSVYLCISFFGMRSAYFMLIPDETMNVIMTEIFRVFSQFCEFPDKFAIIDLISTSYSFFQEYNDEKFLTYQFVYLALLNSIIESSLIDDNDIRSILSNLKELIGFKRFIKSQPFSLPLSILISYNSASFHLDELYEIASVLLPQDYGENNQLILSFISQTYFLFDDQLHQIYLLKINELFQEYPKKCSKLLYYIVSKDMLINETFFDVFHPYLSFDSPYMIPSLLFLLKHENQDFYNEINYKIQLLSESLDINNFLFYIRSMLSKFPSIQDFPFHQNFYDLFSSELMRNLYQLKIYFDNNDDVDLIFSLIKNREFIKSFECWPK